MLAVVHDRYGPPEVLRVTEVDDPLPADDEVLVRVRATTVNRTDTSFRQPRPFFVRAFSGIRAPKHRVLGTEFAGVIEAVGPAVSELRVGDEVFGVNADNFGAHAELLAVKQRAPIAHKPLGLGFDEAAAVCDGFVLARTCLAAGRVGRGTRILVYGASGSIGTAGVQLAKHLGADVTAVCNSKNLELVRSLGADRVLDYTREDFTRSDERYGVVFDAVGKLAFRRSRRALVPGGRFVTTDLGFLWQNPFLVLGTALTRGRRALLPLPRYTKDHVLVLKPLLESGEYRAVIDRVYPLEDVVEATRYVETGQKTGNVVLTL